MILRLLLALLLVSPSLAVTLYPVQTPTKIPSAHLFPMSDGSGWNASSFIAGTGISITYGANTVTIAATGGGAGTGTVTSASVVSANGFSGTVATATTTPAITLSTTASGVLKGSAGSLVAATAGTDYAAPATTLAGYGIADGITAAAVASGYQPLDSDLTAIAALTTTSFGRSLLALADAAAGRTAFGLGTLATQSATITDYLLSATAASTYQPLDSDLTAIAALTTTSFGRSFLALADASAARTLLGLGTAAVLDVPAAGDATTLQVVKGTDSRLTDARTPTTHTHTASQISDSTTAGRSLLTAATVAAQRTALSLVPGTDVQAWDADLDAFAALAGTSTLYYRSGANTWSAVTYSGGIGFSGGALSLGAITPSSVASAGAVSGTSLTASGLTSGRVPFVSTGGLLADSASFSYSAGTVTATTFAGALSGNASTATALATARNINGVSFNGSANINLLTPTAVKSANYTASAGELVPCDATSAFAVTLPNAPADGSLVAVKIVTQPGANAVTINCAGSDVFNKTGGSTSGNISLLNQATLLQYKASGGIWYAVSADIPLTAQDARFAAIAQTHYVGTTSIAANRASASQALTGITSIDGSAATLTTPRSIYGNNFDGSSALGQIIVSTYGGTGNGFTKFSGPATSEKTFTLPNASATVLTDNAAVTVAQGGTGVQTATAYAPLFGGTTGTGAFQSGTVGTAGQVLTSNGAGALPTFQAATGGSSPLITAGAAVTISSTAETSVFGSYSVAGGTLANNGDMMQLRIPFTYLNNSAAGTLTLKIKIGGTTVYSDASVSITSSTTTRICMLTIDFVRTSSTTCDGLAKLTLGNVSGATTGLGDLANNPLTSAVDLTVGFVAGAWTWANSTSLDVTFTAAAASGTTLTTSGAHLRKLQ